MKSCLYNLKIMHHRLAPREHRFETRIFMFYLDLDEVGQIDRRLRLFRSQRFGIYSFQKRDHIELGGESVKENLLRFLEKHGYRDKVSSIRLLTHLRVFGYVFNPVSFYFCFDAQDFPVCVVPEIGNTFKELKPFLLGEETLRRGAFRDTQKKYFYISPFLPVDELMEFILPVPDQHLRIRINDIRDGKRILLTSMTGTREELSDASLALWGLRIPFVTLKVISLIHWHALRLYLKKVPFFRKKDDAELQRGVYRPHHYR